MPTFPRRSLDRPRIALAVLLLASVCLGGCKTASGEYDEDWEDFIRGVMGQYGINQANQMIQTDAERAGDALERASEQTCEDADEFKTAAAEAEAQVSALAEESQALQDAHDTENDQIERVAGMVSRARQRASENLEEYDAARDAFNEVYGTVKKEYSTTTGVQVGFSVGEVERRANDFINIMDDVASDVMVATQDLQMELATTPDLAEILALGQETRRYSNGKIIEGWPDPDVDVAAELASVDQNHVNFVQRWQAALETEAPIPDDIPKDSLRVEQLDSGDRSGLDDLLGAVSWANSAVFAMQGGLKTATRQLEGTTKVLTNRRYERTDRAEEIRGETDPLAAEATRNAWLAVEACGGEIPDDVAEFIEDPFEDFRSVPQWNSTFWDISSP